MAHSFFIIFFLVFSYFLISFIFKKKKKIKTN